MLPPFNPDILLPPYLCLALAHVLLPEQELTVQVAGLNRVQVNLQQSQVTSTQRHCQVRNSVLTRLSYHITGFTTKL